jgi:integrase
VPRSKRKNHEGTKLMFHEPSGLWYVQVSIGKGKRESIYGKDGAEVIRKRTLRLAEIEKGLVAEPNKNTLGAWLDRWLSLKAPDLSPRSQELYADYLRLYVPASLKKLRVQSIKRSHIKDMMMGLANRKLSLSVRRKVVQHLKAAFAEAIDEGILTVSPANGLTVKATVADVLQDAADKALTLAEMYAFLDASKDDALYPLFYLLFSTGVRRGEALGLRWQYIDFEGRTIEFNQQVKTVDGKAVVGPLKTKKSIRKLSVGTDLLEVLQERRQQQVRQRELAGSAWAPSDLVFTTSLGTPIQPRNVNRSMSRLAEKAGIRHISSHVGRHTNLTHRLRNGEKLEVVSAIAGHKRPSITHDLYRTVFEDEKRASVYSLAEQRKRLPPRS